MGAWVQCPPAFQQVWKREGGFCPKLDCGGGGNGVEYVCVLRWEKYNSYPVSGEAGLG